MLAQQVTLFLAYAMGAIWVVFIILFLALHPRGIKTEIRRAPGWWTGLLLQAAGYAAAFIFIRPFGEPHVHAPLALEIALTISALAIAAASLWMVIKAIRTLGKQWAVAARVIEGHELVTTGPFEVVRHPVYSGLLGMLIATAVAISSWFGLILATALYLVGTEMRIRKEERLMRETFGNAYEEYAKEVPALIPGLF
jgi:isoprenylcysteine carboxyl methyltransferase (ICMT) family protein YpbQ